ncbi:Transketolase [bioreactor metagenome]|jgi:transketolase|uniref:Transketolase n=1 Tax=bioreactor metagenome TaxID=1076179 RepID=A0A644T1V2_9ZZZZ|nr:transketolase [Treponema sp.]
MRQTDSDVAKLSASFPHWEKTKDLVDQCLDIILNYRQSGHPGGSRSKVYPFLATLLSGAMRWDIRKPEKRFGDRFVLGAGHAIPLVYTTLAVLNEAMKLKYQRTGDSKYLVPEARRMNWDDLLGFRRRGGLSGHAEMEGKTLFLKFNTGPSGHGSPAAAGQALALKRAGAGQVRVFIFEGEGGLTPGVTHETMNSAWGLGLDNLYYVVDWNDYGIDEHRVSSSVYGRPEDWFGSHGWRVFGTEQGEDWKSVAGALLTMVFQKDTDLRPAVTWVKSRKGRGYLSYDHASHGTPHKLNSEKFWALRKEFAAKYGATFVNVDGAAPRDEKTLAAEFEANLKAVFEVLKKDEALVDYLAGRLVELGDSVPEQIEGFKLAAGSPADAKTGAAPQTPASPFGDKRLYDYRRYPADLYLKPGSSAANRAALARWGAWVNAFGAKEYGRPLFVVSSADLAGSTNIDGFAKAYGDFPGYGWYQRYGGPEGSLLPQEITEFANAGIMTGMASVNLSNDPEKEFDGFWGATSTYASFSYLVYGSLRLYSQLTQDCQLKTGKVIYVAGHSGPETADDSRTHFGIFSPGVTRLFPKGQVINLHPWEYNEVPVLLGAALATEVPIVALHLTRPAIQLPDRAKLGIPSHFEAAKGAYVLKETDPARPRGGTLFVQGTSAVDGILKILPQIEKLNCKVVCVVSAELFARQSPAYRAKVVSPEDKADSTVVSTQAKILMDDWFFNPLAADYALTSDWDDRWRTGGNLDEVLDEARLSPAWLLKGIGRFVKDRERRLSLLRSELGVK